MRLTLQGFLKTATSAAAIRTAIAFVLSFGLAKGSSFAAALALPRFADIDTYGLIELSMTIGMVGASILGLGAPAAATRAYLVEEDSRGPGILAGYCAWLCGIAVLTSVVCLILKLGAVYACSAALIGMYAFQFSAGTYTRMRGWIFVSGWGDNLTILVMFLIVAAYGLMGATDFHVIIGAVLALSAVIGVASAVWFVRARITDLRGVALQVVRVGGPAMVYAAALLLIFSTARIAIARELTLADVASVSFCGRICLVLVFSSQVLSTGLFRTIYQIDHADAAKVLVLWSSALSILALVLTVAAYFSASLLVLGTDIPAADLAAVFPAVAVQTTLWVLNSNLEMFVVRELVSKQAAIACVAIAAAGLAVGLVVKACGLVSLLTIVNLYSLAMVALLVVQMRILERKGMTFRSAYYVLPLVAAPLLVYLLPARY